jgi:hypothetical protein
MAAKFQSVLDLPLWKTTTNQNWRLLKKQRKNDIVFVCMLSYGIRVCHGDLSISDNLTELIKRECGVDANGVLQEITNVFITAALARVPRSYLERRYTERQPSFFKKREAVYQTSTTQVRPFAKIVHDLSPPITGPGLSEVTADFTFTAISFMASHCGQRDTDPLVYNVNETEGKLQHNLRKGTAVGSGSKPETDKSQQLVSLLLGVMKLVSTKGALACLWSQLYSPFGHDSQDPKGKSKNSFKLFKLFFEFVYLLTHLVYSFALYGVGFDKTDAHQFTDLWTGLNKLAESLMVLSDDQLKIIDEPAAEVVIALQMLSHRSDGSLDPGFPLESHVSALYERIKPHLVGNGIASINLKSTADAMYKCIHRDMILGHYDALELARKKLQCSRVCFENRHTQSSHESETHNKQPEHKDTKCKQALTSESTIVDIVNANYPNATTKTIAATQTILMQKPVSQKVASRQLNTAIEEELVWRVKRTRENNQLTKPADLFCTKAPCPGL